MSGKYIDITNGRFGNWTVLHRVYRQSKRRYGRPAFWLCRCACGVERVVVGSNLRNGQSRGCGCHQRRRTIDLVGQRFGEWLVIAMCPGRRRRLIYWRCRCSCGEERDVRGDGLRDGTSTNCGCVRIEKLRKFATTHGMTGTRAYVCWLDLKARCRNPNHKWFSYYGGRGIGNEWQSFEEFYADMGDPPPNLSIQRFDNDGPYAAWNCGWATRAEQRANQRPPKRKRRARQMRLRLRRPARAAAAAGGVERTP